MAAGATLVDQNAWIENRLKAAIKAATSDAHIFPDAVAVELRSLLSGPLQEPRKPAELDEIATTLVSVNRSSK
jgi:hypothetical protein